MRRVRVASGTSSSWGTTGMVLQQYRRLEATFVTVRPRKDTLSIMENDHPLVNIQREGSDGVPG